MTSMPKINVTSPISCHRSRCVVCVKSVSPRSRIDWNPAERHSAMASSSCSAAPFSGRAIAWPIHDSQNLTGVGQGDNEGMIAPVAFVRDVHAFLALARGRDDRAVGIDLGLGEETGWLSPPDLQPRLVVGLVERGDVRQIKAPAEITRGRGVGNPFSAQGVEVCLVLTAVLDVFQARAIAKGIERDVEHVIRLVVGQVDAKQIEVAIDGVDQAPIRGRTDTSDRCRRSWWPRVRSANS